MLNSIRSTLRPIGSVLIYSGHRKGPFNTLKGPFPCSVENDWEMFSSLKTSASIGCWTMKRIEGENLLLALADTDLPKTLLVLPAGPSSELDEAFDDRELSAIKKSLTEGLRLYSTCGSSYWLAQARIWKGLLKKGKLGIFPGTAIGPLSPYSTPSGPPYLYQAASAKTHKIASRLLLCGGGTLIKSLSSGQKVEVIATYSRKFLEDNSKDASWENCAVTTTYGKGKALLVMLHPHWGAENIYMISQMLNPDSKRPEDWKAIAASLDSEENRRAFTLSLLQSLDPSLF